MPFILSRAEESDCEAIIRLQFEACAQDPGFSTIFPKGGSSPAVNMYAAKLKLDIQHDPECRVMRVLDEETGDLASFCIWHFIPELPQEKIDAEMLQSDFDLPSDANHDAGRKLIKIGNRKRLELMGGKAYAYLSVVGTASKYRRQGAASLCLKYGTEIADHRGLPAYVEGTPDGMSVYRNYGFEVVDKLKLEVSPWKEEDFWNVCMIRPAKTSR